MNQQRTALFSVVAAWIAVLFALILVTTLGGGVVILLILTSISTLAVTFYWARISHRSD